MGLGKRIKKKKSKDDEPASSQPLVRGCWSHNSLQGTRTKPSSSPPTTLRSESPGIVVDRAGNALSGGEMGLLQGCVRAWCAHHCPPSCSSSAITGCPCPSENRGWLVTLIITWKMYFSGLFSAASKLCFCMSPLFVCSPSPPRPCEVTRDALQWSPCLWLTCWPSNYSHLDGSLFHFEVSQWLLFPLTCLHFPLAAPIPPPPSPPRLSALRSASGPKMKHRTDPKFLLNGPRWARSGKGKAQTLKMTFPNCSSQ